MGLLEYDEYGLKESKCSLRYSRSRKLLLVKVMDAARQPALRVTFLKT